MNMGTFPYFAYGSNMLHARLQERCPSARPIGTAIAQGYELRFWKRGKDFSGKATLVKNSETHQHGVLYAIDVAEMALLDKAEGKGYGYDRRNDVVVRSCADDSDLQVATYFAINPERNLQPFDWYLASVIAGAEQNGLPEEMICKLRATHYETDSFYERQSRQTVMTALSKYGITDLNEFLTESL